MKSSLFFFRFQFVFFLSLPFLFSNLSCQETPERKATTITAQTDTACEDLQTEPLSFFMSTADHAFFELAKSTVQDLIPSGINFHLLEDTYVSRAGARHVDFKFSLEGHPLCQYKVGVHNFKDKTYVKGKPPTDVETATVPDFFDMEQSHLSRVLEHLEIEEEAEKTYERDCIVWDDKELKGAKEIEFHVGKLPYYALVTEDDVLQAEGRFFHGTTTSNLTFYVKKPTNSTNLVLSTVEIPDMSDGGSLCSARFRTLNSDNQAFSTDSEFSFDPSDIRFSETSLFANVNLQAEFFLSLDILERWHGPKLDIEMYDVNNFSNNEAVYLIPTSSDVIPTIRLGNGNGVDLQNLFIDFDPVAHELGHHIVYRKLTKVTGEALVLHEGLADFFVYANTKDPCLGRLICPNGGSLCELSQCLRSGEYTKNITDSDLTTQPHRRSQVISSMLWDIGNGNSSRGITGIGVETIAKITLKAIDFIDSEAGYADFLRSLMQADESLVSSNVLSSSKCSTIEAAANSRGFAGILAANGISCSSF